MNSLILRTATRALLPLLLLFSVFLLLRGHNEPGGGFAGGLLAAAAYVLYAMGSGVQAVRQALRIDPHVLIGAGLLLALCSGLWSLGGGLPFMTSQWGEVWLPIVGRFDLGTPLFFDVGVYVAVSGVTLLIILTLAEE